MSPAAMSFSCPHFAPTDDACLRLKTDCVPGRPGCVLPADTGYAVPAAERIRRREEEKRRSSPALPPWPPAGNAR
jgi:hypothetical protein